MKDTIKKYLFVGPQSQCISFLQKVQKLAALECIGSQYKTSEGMEILYKAIRILAKWTPSSAAVPAPAAIHTAREILHLQKSWEEAHKSLQKLQNKKEEALPWGDIPHDFIKTLEEKTGRKAKLVKAGKELDPPKDFFLLLVKDKTRFFLDLSSSDELPEGFLQETWPTALSYIQEQEKELVFCIKNAERDLSAYAAHLHKFQECLLKELNQNSLEGAYKSSSAALKNRLFSIEAWVPRQKIDRIQMLAHAQNILCEEIPIEADERIPTRLHNKGPAKLGEDLLLIYDTPSSKDSDPSLWLFVFFPLFFAIIIADAGYGLVLFLLSLYLHTKLSPLKDFTKRFVQLSYLLSLTTILWGFLNASYFGISLPIDHFLRSYSLLDWLVQKKFAFLQLSAPSLSSFEELFPSLADSIQIELALTIGIFHISLSLLRSLRENFSHLGWLLCLWGGYLYFPSFLQAFSASQFLFNVDLQIAATLGLLMIQTGVGLACALALVQRGWKGILEITTLIALFSDVLSYLRLYALALAGAMMSRTFNDIGASMPLLPGILVIFCWHTINTLLSVMGAVIHGLRLNFLEWYHYSFEGGGRLFSPLRLHKTPLRR